MLPLTAGFSCTLSPLRVVYQSTPASHCLLSRPARFRCRPPAHPSKGVHNLIMDQRTGQAVDAEGASEWKATIFYPNQPRLEELDYDCTRPGGQSHGQLSLVSFFFLSCPCDRRSGADQRGQGDRECSRFCFLLRSGIHQSITPPTYSYEGLLILEN